MVFKLLLMSCIFLIFSCGSDISYQNNFKGQESSIIAQVKNEGFSSEVEKKLINIIQLIENYKSLSDYEAVRDLQFEFNEIYETELTWSLFSGDDVSNIRKKYRALRKIKSVTKNHIDRSSGSFVLKALGPKKEGDTGMQTPGLYHPLVLKEVLKVYKDYGKLYIRETVDKNNKVKLEQVQSKKIPWSGYWYPFSNNELYKGEKSPLAKFDKVVKNNGGLSQSRSYQEKITNGLGSTSWEGLCDAWAIAAVVASEPQKGLTVGSLTFGISDLKALLTFSHLKYPYKQYGISYRGDAETDGTYQDIKPEAFHQVVTSVLGKEKRAVVIDDMAGVQVWNKPLYRYRWKIVKDPEVKDAFLVRAYPWLVKERSSETDLLTNGKDTIAPIYDYRLYVDKENKRDGKYLVIAGEWIKNSYRDHPDNIKVPHKKGDLGSHNSEFNKNIEFFKRYLLNSY